MAEDLTLYVDFFPAGVKPLPEGVPAGRKIRAMVTGETLTIGWSNGYLDGKPSVGRVDIPLSDSEVSRRGGTVTAEDGTEYAVTRISGCSSCGAGGLKMWNPFPERRLVYTPVESEGETAYGVPPTRYTRT